MMVAGNQNRFLDTARRTASAQGEAEISTRMKTLESVYELTRSPELGESLRRQRELLALARRPARTFSPEVRQAVSGYLEENGPHP